MELSKKMRDEMNKQFVKEYYSSYLYLSMSAYFETQNLPGFAYWMRMQADEEMIHAMKFFDYINERGSKVELDVIDKPETNWSSPVKVFEATVEHERLVTSYIHNLVKIAREENDM